MLSLPSSVPFIFSWMRLASCCIRLSLHAFINIIFSVLEILEFLLLFFHFCFGFLSIFFPSRHIMYSLNVAAKRNEFWNPSCSKFYGCKKASSVLSLTFCIGSISQLGAIFLWEKFQWFQGENLFWGKCEALAISRWKNLLEYECWLFFKYMMIKMNIASSQYERNILCLVYYLS